jgi:DNA polymerase-3 subunit delta'
VTLAHPDRRADAEELARRIGPEGALRRIDAVLDCRRALEQNVKPQVAVEALTVALRLPG